MMTLWRSRSVGRWLTQGWFPLLAVLLCALALPAALGAQASSADKGKPAHPPLSPLAAAERFKTTLLQMGVAASGSFGDEGPMVLALVESLSAALADVDRAIHATELRADRNDCSTEIDLARAQFAIGRVAEAQRALERGARDPHCVEALLLQGVAHLRADHTEQALAAFRVAVQRDPDNQSAAYWLIHTDPAVIETPEGQRAMDALRAAYKAILTSPERRAAGKPAAGTLAVLDVTSRFSTGTPNVLPVDYIAGYSLLLAGEHQRGLAALRQAAAADPLMSGRVRAIPEATAGIAALREGHLSEARERFKQAVARDPASSEVRRLLASAYWLEHDLEHAAEELTASVDRRPNDERTRLMLARVLNEMGALEKSEAVLRDTLERLPRSGLAQLWLALVSEKLNRDAEMARLYATIARSVPLDGQARLFAMAGNLYQNAGEPDESFAAFVKSVRADPNAPDLHAALAREHLEYGRHDSAFAEYVATLLLDPSNANAWLGIGQLALDAGETADAVVALERLIALQPGYPAARHMLGNALMRLGRAEEGARQLAEFQRLEAAAAERRRTSMTSGVLREEALVRTAEGDVARAAALWEQVIEREPDVAAHHAALGALLINAGQPEAALPHLERAAALGGVPDVFRRLAIVYNALGRHDAGLAARTRYERAVLAPASAESGR